MFPWDHLAIGYVAVSLWLRLRGRRVDDLAWLAVVVGTQFPDLVDKPLSWTFAVLPTGTTLAHSVFVAVPLSAAVYLLARRRGRPDAGAAFGIGYLLHLPADVLYGPLALGSPVVPGTVLWPLVTKAATDAGGGLLANTVYYILRFYTVIDSTRALGFLLVEAGLILGALALWIADGRPGVRPVSAAVRRAVA
ncbi:metal-dependent hydrolase [Halobaculum sp. EA56]|uniref:metal-dependent hydrolase n=1 Tax=Halobaculum sp. EA56 TaxID=3421648 RepID=UPI003EB71580